MAKYTSSSQSRGRRRKRRFRSAEAEESVLGLKPARAGEADDTVKQVIQHEQRCDEAQEKARDSSGCDGSRRERHGQQSPPQPKARTSLRARRVFARQRHIPFFGRVHLNPYRASPYRRPAANAQSGCGTRSNDLRQRAVLDHG
jgi:hypothetical protein